MSPSTLFVFITWHLPVPSQLLLSNTSTDANLEGDLGNTPLMLACSVNNCEALNMLVSMTKRHGGVFTFFFLILLEIHLSKT